MDVSARPPGPAAAVRPRIFRRRSRDRRGRPVPRPVAAPRGIP